MLTVIKAAPIIITAWLPINQGRQSAAGCVSTSRMRARPVANKTLPS
jgi:hypothetical protein